MKNLDDDSKYSVLRFVFQPLIFSLLIVPIYDAQKAKYDRSVESFALQKEDLPRFPGDVPQNACVQVCYSVGTRKNSRISEGVTLSFNVQFVIVLAV